MEAIKTKPTMLLGIIFLVIGILFFSILIIGEISKNVERENEETTHDITENPQGYSWEDNTICISSAILFSVIGFTLIVIGLSQSQQQELSNQILEHLQQQPQSRQCNSCKKQIPIDSKLCPYCGLEQ